MSKIFNKKLLISTICVALSGGLAFIKLFEMPQGGEVTALSMIFIALVGYWFGWLPGLIAGVAHGLIRMAIEMFYVNPIQLLVDYIFAFAVIGLVAGLLRNYNYGLYLGYILGVLGRFVFSFASGVIFFGEYAPEGYSAIMYSATYNLSYLLPEMAMTFIIIVLPPVRRVIDKVCEWE